MTSRRAFLKAAGAVGGLGVLATVGAGGQSASGSRFPAPEAERADPEPYEGYTVRRVPEEYETIQAAVEAAEPEDLVLVGPGVYRESVRVIDTPRLTIRGTDRTEVILEGDFERQDGFTITADGVAVENLTARHFQRNGFFWSSVTGWRGSYLTAYNNRLYGIYALDSRHGQFEESYASGHTDSGFYIGQSKPAHARITNVVSENNAIGYSGTNAGGHLTIEDSTFKNNMAGIVPNSLDSEADPPQEAARIQTNIVWDNNNADAPDEAFGYAAFGTGINVAGGVGNEILGNTVEGHANFGIVLTPMIDENLYTPRGNLVEDNDVSDSGRADLALGAPQGGHNVFTNNGGDGRPTRLKGDARNPSGDPWVTMVLLEQYAQLEGGSAPRGDWKRAPEPPAHLQESMPNPEDTPPREAVGEVL